jgi:ring-1,2-phenylacetyl-CoA epoxidase subunit PaaE
LEALKDKFIERFSLFHILSRERSDSPLNEGRIDIEKCMALNRIINLYKADEYFICGPEQLILTIRKLLEENLVERKNIHYELFSTPGQQLNNRIEKHIKEDIGGKKSRITVKSDGIAFDFDLAYDTKSILDAAIEQGADLPFACKGGVCSTCRARLLEGSVEMDVNYALEQDELEAGYILTCQSHPRTEKVTIDYDSK